MKWSSEQYLGPLAKGIQVSNKRVDDEHIEEVIMNFVDYENHAKALADAEVLLNEDKLEDIAYRGGLSISEQADLERLVDKAADEIRRRMKVFELDQISLTNKR